MKKILFIINSLSYKAGTERVACNLANLFVEKLAYQIEILNRDTIFENVAYSLNKNIKVHAFTGNYFQFYKKIQKYLKEKQPDYLIIHNMGRLSLLCGLLKKKNTKIISLEHVSFDSRPTWVRNASKIIYKNINKVITLTYRDEKHYKSWYNNVTTIYNISPFSIYELKSKKNKDIIAIGRLTYQKNFQALLQAWIQINKQIDDWSLKIYGVGEDFNELNTIINQNQLKNVELMGQTNHIENIYKTSSLFVMSSRFEGLPMVLIEAQTFGLPIISFDCPHGPAEIVTHQQNGLLVENQNIQLLANSMLDLIQNNEKREKYAQQALKDAERFQQSTILMIWETVFKELQS